MVRSEDEMIKYNKILRKQIKHDLESNEELTARINRLENILCEIAISGTKCSITEKLKAELKKEKVLS